MLLWAHALPVNLTPGPPGKSQTSCDFPLGLSLSPHAPAGASHLLFPEARGSSVALESLLEFVGAPWGQRLCFIFSFLLDL